MVDPDPGTDLVGLEVVPSIDLGRGTASVAVTLTIAACSMRHQIRGDAVDGVPAQPGIDRVGAQITAMTSQQRSAGGSSPRSRASRTDAGELTDPGARGGG